MNILISSINILMETVGFFFYNWLDDLCYDVFVELAMILSENRHETSVMTSDTLDNPFVMSL